jgi:hypothetical protein
MRIMNMTSPAFSTLSSIAKARLPKLETGAHSLLRNTPKERQFLADFTHGEKRFPTRSGRRGRKPDGSKAFLGFFRSGHGIFWPEWLHIC